MAINGNNILIGTMNGSTFTALAAVKSHDANNSADTLEKASATQQDYKEFIPGRKEWNINVNYLVLNDSNSNVEDLLKVGTIYAAVACAVIVTCRTNKADTCRLNTLVHCV